MNIGDRVIITQPNISKKSQYGIIVSDAKWTNTSYQYATLYYEVKLINEDGEFFRTHPFSAKNIELDVEYYRDKKIEKIVGE